MWRKVLLAFLALGSALPALADDPPPPVDSGGSWQDGELQSPTPPPPDLPESPPSLTETGTVQDWGGPYQFYTPPGTYVLEADPILPQGRSLGGLPTGDIGKALKVQPEKSVPAYVYYDPTNGPPEFERDPSGREYVYITDAGPPPNGLRFSSREEAVYWLGEDTVKQLEQTYIDTPSGTIPAMGYFDANQISTRDYCSVSNCAALQEMKAQQAAEAWANFVREVENFVEAVVDWITSVVDTIVDWFKDLFGV